MKNTSEKEIRQVYAKKAGKKTSLYIQINKRGEILYIGVSLNASSRSKDHKAQSKWFEEIKAIHIEWFDNRWEAETMELVLIKLLKPKYNIAHNDERPLRNSLMDQWNGRIKIIKKNLSETALKATESWQLKDANDAWKDAINMYFDGYFGLHPQIILDRTALAPETFYQIVDQTIGKEKLK